MIDRVREIRERWSNNGYFEGEGDIAFLLYHIAHLERVVGAVRASPTAGDITTIASALTALDTAQEQDAV